MNPFFSGSGFLQTYRRNTNNLKNSEIHNEPLYVSFADSFVANTETPNNPVSRSFTVKGLSDLAGDLIERNCAQLEQ